MRAPRKDMPARVGAQLTNGANPRLEHYLRRRRRAPPTSARAKSAPNAPASAGRPGSVTWQPLAPPPSPPAPLPLPASSVPPLLPDEPLEPKEPLLPDEPPELEELDELDDPASLGPASGTSGEHVDAGGPDGPGCGPTDVLLTTHPFCTCVQMSW